jgi:hypothetical protein
MNEVKMLREHIRKLISNVRKEQKQEYKNKIKEERTLRRFVRTLIKEGEDTSPSFSTGINVLKDLLATIVPILADEYKNLTTDPEQRKSFRSHTVKAIQNLLAPESMLRKAADQAKAASAATPVVPAQSAAVPPVEGEEESLTEQEELEVGQQPTDPRFVDVDSGLSSDKPDPTDPETAFETIPGADVTGRDMAKKSFRKIQKQILEAYSTLHNDKDVKLFYDYLITNVKLHFDKFEDELQPTLSEPTTDAYEAERSQSGVVAGTPQSPVPEEVPEEEI